jgi:hypothetical protein
VNLLINRGFPLKSLTRCDLIIGYSSLLDTNQVWEDSAQSSIKYLNKILPFTIQKSIVLEYPYTIFSNNMHLALSCTKIVHVFKPLIGIEQIIYRWIATEIAQLCYLDSFSKF